MTDNLYCLPRANEDWFWEFYGKVDPELSTEVPVSESESGAESRFRDEGAAARSSDRSALAGDGWRKSLSIQSDVGLLIFFARPRPRRPNHRNTDKGKEEVETAYTSAGNRDSFGSVTQQPYIISSRRIWRACGPILCTRLPARKQGG